MKRIEIDSANATHSYHFEDALVHQIRNESRHHNRMANLTDHSQCFISEFNLEYILDDQVPINRWFRQKYIFKSKLHSRCYPNKLSDNQTALKQQNQNIHLLPNDFTANIMKICRSNSFRNCIKFRSRGTMLIFTRNSRRAWNDFF